MRTENIKRLTIYHTNIFDPIYLTYKFLFPDIKDAASKYGKGRVMDIGCGNKPYEPLFKNITEYVGCDIVQSSEHKVDVICYSTDIPLESETFDTVVSTQVIEHVEDHFKMLQEAFRLLKPGGNIIVTAPMAWEHHETPYDFFRFTRYGLKYLFEKAGFEIDYIKPNGGKWAFLGQMKQNVLRNSLEGKGGFKKILYLIFRYCMKPLINIKYSLLEKWDGDKEGFITTNFIIVARKP